MARFDATYAPNANINKVDGTNLLGLAGMYNKYLSDIDTRIQNNEMHPLRMDLTKAQTDQANMVTQRGLYDLDQAKFMDQNYMDRFGVNARTKIQDIANNLSLAQTDQLNINNEFNRYNNAETIRVNNMYEQMTGRPAGLSALIKDDWLQSKTGVGTNGNDVINNGVNNGSTGVKQQYTSLTDVERNIAKTWLNDNYDKLKQLGFNDKQISQYLAVMGGESDFDTSKINKGVDGISNLAGITGITAQELGIDPATLRTNDLAVLMPAVQKAMNMHYYSGSSRDADRMIPNTADLTDVFMSYKLGHKGWNRLKALPDNALVDGILDKKTLDNNPAYKGKTKAELISLLTGRTLEYQNIFNDLIAQRNGATGMVSTDANNALPIDNTSTITKLPAKTKEGKLNNIIGNFTVEKDRNQHGFMPLTDEWVNKLNEPMVMYITNDKDDIGFNAMSYEDYENSDDLFKEQMKSHILGTVPKEDIASFMRHNHDILGGRDDNNIITKNDIAMISHRGKNGEILKNEDGSYKIFRTSDKNAGNEYTRSIRNSLFNNGYLLSSDDRYNEVYTKNLNALTKGFDLSKDKELDALTYDLGTNKNNSQIRFNTLAILGPSAEYLSRLPLNDRKAIFKWLVTMDDSKFNKIEYDNFLDKYPSIGRTLKGKEKDILYNSLKMATDISKYFDAKGLNGGGASGDIPVVGFPNFPVATRIPEEALEYAIDQAEMEAEKSQVEDAIGKMIVDNMDLAKNIMLRSELRKGAYSDKNYIPHFSQERAISSDIIRMYKPELEKIFTMTNIPLDNPNLKYEDLRNYQQNVFEKDPNQFYRALQILELFNGIPYDGMLTD